MSLSQKNSVKSHNKEIRKIIESNNTTEVVDYLKAQKLIYSNEPPICSKCDLPMSWYKRENISDMWSWRCVDGCRTFKSIRSNSFLSLFSFPICLFLKLVQQWCLNMVQGDTEAYLGKSKHTIKTLYQMLRLVVLKSLRREDIRIGGPNKVNRIQLFREIYITTLPSFNLLV